MHILFANTGVQVICVPLKGGARYNVSQIGNGWQRTKCGAAEEQEQNTKKKRDPQPESTAQIYPYIQWQIIQGTTSRLYLAVDTTCGDAEIGYFCDVNSLTGDFIINLENIQDLNGQPLRGVPMVEICIRPAAAVAGDAKHVHMVVDFGNSRTGALLLEVVGEISQTPQMLPFELTNRYHLDAWDDEGQYRRNPGARWFSSKTHWCNTPYLSPQMMRKIEFQQVDEGGKKSGWFGFGKSSASVRTNKVEVARKPDIFEDVSMVRMGKEADDVLQVIATDDDIRTGVSSPKRYLWADDSSWLEGANWHMADPYDREQSHTYCGTLRGAMLKYIHEDDNDFLLKETGVKPQDFAPETPLKPRHAPRTLMTGAIYELLAQAYTYVNSIAYRMQSGDAGRAREIRTLTLTYPSGMIFEEKERLQKQVQKAIEIFNMTLGRHQHVKPLLNLSIDEASAVHLTYIWSELRLLGQDPRIWFESLHQERGNPEKKEEEEAPAAPMLGSPASRRRMGAMRGGATQKEEFGEKNHDVRLACIDIGGGTSDLMIASYKFESKIDDSIRGKVLHQDGISLAGDQLAKRLLERIILPAFADALAMDEEDVKLLFGPEVPRNREFRGHRITWMNRLFIPMAQKYMTLATDGITDEPVNHMDPELIDPAILESLQRVFDKLRGPGYYNLQQDMELYYHPQEFEDVVIEVFDELIFDFCKRCIDYNVDAVLLAGQPSKLGFIQKLVRMYLPLPPSRILPMFHHYAGNWYPYQDENGRLPGIIIDPKSPVVVGAAINFMATNGMLPQFKFEMEERVQENTYYWGVMSDSTSGIRPERILFSPAEAGGGSREEITEFTTSSQRVIIGRKMSPIETAQASPIYVIKMDVGDRIGRTNVSVKIKRVKADGERDEYLQVEGVSGVVAGEDAVLDENVFFAWRTLADERYYLDTGGLDNIELGGAV
ncbi:MAG: virulence factor SrfB [Thermoguttaceae bacterium]|nr:virulence factor SrfB [Thermoguttaceae bacterium]